MKFTVTSTRLFRVVLGSAVAALVAATAACGSSDPSSDAADTAPATTAAAETAPDAAASAGSAVSPSQDSGTATGESDQATPAPATDSAPASDSAAASPRDLLPQRFKDSGVIRVGATISYPPNQFYEDDNKTAKGISIDLTDALGEVLGVEFQFTNVAFQGIIPGLMADQFDVVINSMAATPERNEQFTLLIYQNTAGGILVPGGNPDNVSGLEDLCGKKVAVLQGAHFEEQLVGYSKELCTDEGHPAIDITRYDNSSDQYGSVAAGRTAAAFNSYDVAKYTADRSNGTVSVVDELYPDQPYGAIFTKENLELATALQAALNATIDDGSYLKALQNWGAEKEAVETAELLPATG